MIVKLAAYYLFYIKNKLFIKLNKHNETFYKQIHILQ